MPRFRVISRVPRGLNSRKCLWDLSCLGNLLQLLMEFSLIIMSRLLMYVTKPELNGLKITHMLSSSLNCLKSYAVFISTLIKMIINNLSTLRLLYFIKSNNATNFGQQNISLRTAGMGGGGRERGREGRGGKEEVLRSNDNKIGCTVTSKWTLQLFSRNVITMYKVYRGF